MARLSLKAFIPGWYASGLGAENFYCLAVKLYCGNTLPSKWQDEESEGLGEGLDLIYRVSVQMYAKKKQNPACMHSWSTATWGKDALK